MARDLIIQVPGERTRVIVWRSRKDRTVVSHSRTLKTALEKAEKAGLKEPVVIFVPQRGKRYIY